jgi:hypothetical protein
MTPSDATISSAECTLETITAFMVPFFLAGAGGNPDIAKAAIRDLILAHNPETPAEMDLAGRIVAFSIVGLDNLRLSKAPDLSDTKVIRYRSNAITLMRSSDQARKILTAVREKREPTLKIPRPSVAPAPAAPETQRHPAGTKSPAHAGAPKNPPQDIEALKRDARALTQMFSKNGAPSSVSMPLIADPAVAAARAATAAIGNLRRA